MKKARPSNLRLFVTSVNLNPVEWGQPESKYITPSHESRTHLLRLKQNISKLGYGLPEVLRLQPISWRWKTHPESGEQLGLVAQEVEPVLPELVSTSKDAEQMKGLNYTGLLPYSSTPSKNSKPQIQKQAHEINRLKQRKPQQSQQQQSPIQLRQKIKQQRDEISRLKQLVCLDHPKAALFRKAH